MDGLMDILQTWGSLLPGRLSAARLIRFGFPHELIYGESLSENNG